MQAAKGSIKPRLCIWALWLSILLSLALPTLWVTSYFIGRGEDCLAFGYHFYAILRDGRIDLSSDLDTQCGYARPLVANPRLIVSPRVLRSGSAKVPGFELHFCYLAGGYLMWSLGLSLVIPTVLSVLSTALLFHRLSRRPSPVSSRPGNAG